MNMDHKFKGFRFGCMNFMPSSGKYLWKYSESLDFAIRIPFPFLDAFIGIQDTESTYLIRVFTYSIRLQAILVDMKEPLDFTWGLTLKIHTRGPLVLVIY